MVAHVGIVLPARAGMNRAPTQRSWKRPGVPGTRGDSALTKEEFLTLVADKGGMAKTEAGRAVEAFCGAVAEAMEKGEAVRLLGFSPRPHV